MANIYALGPEGTFSSVVAQLINNDNSMDYRYTTSISEAIHKTLQETESIAVVPIENNSTGIIGLCQDAIEEFDVSIYGEIQIPINFSLIHKAKLDEVRIIYVHPQAFNQCTRNILKITPNATPVYTHSNVDSMNKLLAADDPYHAAIAPAGFSDNNLPGGYQKIEPFQNDPENMTRFLKIGPKSESFDFNLKKTSIFIDAHEDRPSLLFQILKSFHDRDINLSMLHSRPSKKFRGNYTFFIDFINNNEATVREALESLKSLNINYRVLGSYDTIEVN